MKSLAALGAVAVALIGIMSFGLGAEIAATTCAPAAQTLEGTITVPYSVTVTPHIQLDVQANATAATTCAPQVRTLPDKVYLRSPSTTCSPPVIRTQPVQTPATTCSPPAVRIIRPQPVIRSASPNVRVYAPGVDLNVVPVVVQIPEAPMPPELTFCQKLRVRRAIRTARAVEPDPDAHPVAVLPSGNVLYRKQYETPIRDALYGRFEVR